MSYKLLKIGRNCLTMEDYQIKLLEKYQEDSFDVFPNKFLYNFLRASLQEYLEESFEKLQEEKKIYG